MSLFNELKRRNVFRVAIAYVIVAWLVIQVADVVLNNITAPDWVFQVLILFLAIGFPFAVIFAWAFEMTPEGLQREHEVDRSRSITSQTGRRLDFLIIGVLVVAVGILLVDKFLLSESPMTPETVAEDVAVLKDTVPSIAVLPFANMSADESSAYFSDGLADTVLHMLAQIRELRVAARTSSFQFRGQSLDVAEIGERLNVGTILEGSVQRSGDKIRVTAQLIDVSSGYHLWSGNFDRELKDIFAIQDEIATAVVSALKVSLLGESAVVLNRDQTDNVDAYTNYLLGINDLNYWTMDSIASAISHFREAVRLDPDYVAAHSMLGRAYLENTNNGSMDLAEGLAAARVAANHALNISANSSAALAVLGLADLREGKLDTAGQILNKAVENGPNDTFALNSYAEYLLTDGRPAEGIATLRKILSLDPLSESALRKLTYILSRLEQFSEASETLARWKNIYPMSPVAGWYESWNESVQGNFAAAIAPMTHGSLLDKNDPEYLVELGILYLEMDMPTEASQWFDRAVEVNPQHPVSRAAPLWVNDYLQQNQDENFQLARELLNDRVDERSGSRSTALRVLVEHAARTGRHEVALETLDNLYPHLFDDPPYDLNVDPTATYYAGIALIQSGDNERGSYLMQSFSELEERYEEPYGVSRASFAARLILGDTDGALDKLAGLAQKRYHNFLNRLMLERSSVFDPLRNEPAFIELLDKYRENAAEQRLMLQAMNVDASEQ
ncbi:membrane protein of unknown function [uncultured Woeseiaceae bacterium]|uniref:Uncharacterized protein n=1 Tax=uncultured Woeseiaceae bacterium TaxID=1983305 RepID=A0A7D9H4E9_9GAMM|nr:membrane protein of unknown function [uncultured Woeseiaceae bacterium]